MTQETTPARMLPRLWIAVPVLACACLVWFNMGRVRRVEYVSGLEGRAGQADVLDAGSPTGYANGQREQIVPESNEDSFHWIAQTQQMFARGEARVRHVDYENAPAGRDVNSTSPYRWWLGLVAWAQHEASGRPIGLCVEKAALFCDPLLHLLVVAGCAAFVAWRFGGFAAALLSIGLVAVFPFASGFLPGMPDQHGLASACALASILVLLAGVGARQSGAPGRKVRIWFALAGVAGGLGMWVSVPTQVPVTAGMAAGALLEAWVARRAAFESDRGSPLPWRTWAFAGAATVLAAYFAEFFPGHMGSWRLDTIHPLYGLAWIGVGEVLARAVPWIRRAAPSWTARDIAAVVLGLAAVASLPVAFRVTNDPTFLAKDSLWARLTRLPNGAAAASAWAWLTRDGASRAAWATLLPLAAAVPAAWLVARRPESRQSALLAVAFGPVLVCLGFALQRLGWWSVLDAALLALAVAAAAGDPGQGGLSVRWLTAALVAAPAAFGVALLVPRGPVGPGMTLTAKESEQLIERHLGHWIQKRTGEAGIVVFAPPNETTALCYFGGLRGVGTFAADNRAGFGATLGIAAATTMEEAQGGLQGHGVRYIVIPSWDPFFEDFARLYLVKKFASRSSLLISSLRRWNLPPWLRPVPYQLPVGGAFEGQSVLVFEVVDEQSPAAAASRLAEYFVETGDLGSAAAAAESLRRFPGDVGALAARAQVQGARGDSAAYAKTLESLLSRLSIGGDRYLPWDRRISLATVLARAGKYKLAHDQLVRCIEGLKEDRLRSLTTGSLYDLLVLAHAFRMEIPDPRLRELAVGLLPDNLRSRI